MTKEQREAIKSLNEFANTKYGAFTAKEGQTVLSMLKEQQEENKKKDKIIDLMADFIFQNIDVEEDICNSAYIKCKQETGQDITCINCIKQYFERKVIDR